MVDRERQKLSLSSSVQLSPSVNGYHQSIYSCLTALKDGEHDLLVTSLADARWASCLSCDVSCDCHVTCRSEVIRALCSSGLESAYGLYPSMSRLLSILELEEAGQDAGRLGSRLARRLGG